MSKGKQSGPATPPDELDATLAEVRASFQRAGRIIGKELERMEYQQAQGKSLSYQDASLLNNYARNLSLIIRDAADAKRGVTGAEDDGTQMTDEEAMQKAQELLESRQERAARPLPQKKG